MFKDKDKQSETSYLNKLKKKIKKNDVQMAEIQKIASIGTWDWDILDNKVTWSDELYRIYGLNPEEFGASFEAFIERIYHEDQSRVKGIIETVLKTYETAEFEERIIRPDGSIRYLKSKAEVLLDESGFIIGLIGICHDITAVKEKYIVEEYAEKLKEANKATNDILESITDAFFSLSLDWKFIYINNESEKMLNKSREELIGVNIWEQFPESINSNFYYEYNKAITEQKSVEFEEYFPSTNKWFSIRAFPSSTNLAVYFHDITEKKISQKKINDNEARLKALFELIPQIVWTSDESGILDYFNSSWYEYTGKMSSDSKSWAQKDVIHDNDKISSLNIWKNAIKNKNKFEFKCRFKRYSDNSYRWHLCRGVPMFNNEGEVTKWFGTFTDIEEQMYSEQVQSFLAEAGSLLISSIDYETTLQNIAKIAVPKFADWCGVDIVKNDKLVRLAVAHQDPEKIALAKEFIEKYPVDLNAEQGLPNVIRTGKSEYVKEIPDEIIESIPDEQQKEYIKKLGIHSFIVVPLNLNGKTIGAITFVNDKNNKLYTEEDLKIAEDLALRASLAIDNAYLYQKTKDMEYNFRFLTEAIPQQVWTALPDGALDYVNKQVTDYFNLSFEDVIGQGWLNVIHPEDVSITSENWITSITKGENYETEFRLIKSDKNEYRWHIARALPLKNENGEVLKWFGTNTDIHELKEIEEKLAKKSLELEYSNKELQNFAYVASHDLQEPLRTITSYISLILMRYKNKIDNEDIDFFDIISNAATRMRKLIEDLLEYSKVGKQEFINVDLNEAMSNIISNLKVTIEENNASILYDELPVIKAIPSQMLQLFQNIISNSIKYRSERDPVIKISANKNNNEWKFSISDNGLGINKLYFEKIFIIFQRLHEKGKYEGTGIGLATCKKIIELHHGNIWLESEEGKGSTFYFTVPI